MNKRTAIIERKTAETDIRIGLDLNGRGECDINTGCGFLNHMLTLFAKHTRFDFSVFCKGDTDVDYHHSAEDIGIALGCGFKEALGDKKGIKRYAHKIIPMDETLVLCAVDISGRGHLEYNLPIPNEKIGDFDSELVEEFFAAFAREAKITLHINLMSGKNSHHIAEGAFKAFARALSEAAEIDERYKDEIPSTKGVL